uniref:Uncharacterized protein n=1 Tax=Triticum urartu TaxID=4572 RepID=A0A8R7QA56_TRIUA
MSCRITWQSWLLRPVNLNSFMFTHLKKFDAQPSGVLQLLTTVQRISFFSLYILKGACGNSVLPLSPS